MLAASEFPGHDARRFYSSRPIPPKKPSSSASDAATAAAPKVTIQTIGKLHREDQPISVVTAYDYPTGCAADSSGVDIVLVGDSLAMVALGYKDTTEITLDEMIHHCKAVARGVQRAWLVADLPFGSYNASTEQAIHSSVRMVKEGRAEAVKLEGGKRLAPRINAIVHDAGIPVVGHIGLTPQSAVALGGFRVQGRSLDDAKRLIDDAFALQDAGCSIIVLEAIPPPVAETITRLLAVPTIGIGAGPLTSGQVLVISDMMGMFDRFTPKFCKQYLNMGQQLERELARYTGEVRGRKFPELGTHTYSMSAVVEDEWSKYVQKEFGLDLASASSLRKDRAAKLSQAAVAGTTADQG
ncbi:cell wall biogenesis and architecture protein [Spiromyces aspiralis]|uniref:Cell wall biogenesis and architecture protein n=1 Tax=Spiromyces aspiralis TaxID=68401 RepID=A0ACC1HGE5_9FUNG|nr:cell wall biogenesis and architecture protein [Spiromyces aspiralis]